MLPRYGEAAATAALATSPASSTIISADLKLLLVRQEAKVRQLEKKVEQLERNASRTNERDEGERTSRPKWRNDSVASWGL